MVRTFMKGDRRQYGAAIVLFHLLAGCGAPEAEQAATNRSAAEAPAARPVADAADRRLVVVFGDSLFAGYGLSQDEGFAPSLQRALAARGIAAEVFNAGVSGDTSAAGRARLDFVLDGLPRKPDLVVLGLGANDMLRGQPPAGTRANLDAMLAELERRGIPAMLTGMVAAPNLGPDYAAAFNPIYPELAARYDVPLYPFFLAGVIGDRALMLPDGVHPNAAGIAKITGRVVDDVAGRLSDPA